MSAISTDERREVARRLRKTIGLMEFAEALGFYWADDSDWGWKDVSNLVADLIEPTCDRDALLALADEIGMLHGRCDFCINRGECDWADEAICLENMMDDFADRIREALGVDK